MGKESTKSVISPDFFLNLERENLELTVGSLDISVLSTRADLILPEERATIRKARKAYGIWGGNSKLEGLLEDPFDNFEPLSSQANYLTYHFIATIHDASKQEPQKTVTMRMIHTLREEVPVPEDFTIWLIQNKLTATQTTLDQYIRENPEFFRSRTVTNDFMYPAVISRLGTIDGKDAQINPDRRILTPVAFAAIQLAAGKVCQSNFIAAQLRPELKEKYLSVTGSEGEKVMLGFTPTLETLGLDKSNKMVLDNSNPTVHELKTHFPGYWLNEALFRDFIFRCVNEAAIPISFFRQPLNALLESDSQRLSDEIIELIQRFTQSKYAKLSDKEKTDLLTTITDSRFARHLVPLVNNSRIGAISRKDFHQQMLQQSGDGPYSVLMDVDQWVASANNVLQVASERLKS